VTAKKDIASIVPKALTIFAPVENHRKREKGLLVYPVYSRRSEGLSLGINLFPDKKCCSFDCPYCEVFPFSTDAIFSLEEMEEDLRNAIAAAIERNVPVKDICFSGNGEPTLSPNFPAALKRAARLREELIPSANLVLITNGTGLLDAGLFPLLREAALSSGLDIWLKVDAGTPGWYGEMNRSNIPFEKLIEKIKDFASCAPITIQTMLCAVDGKGPPPEEEETWGKLIVELLAIAALSAAESKGGGIRKVQIYGKARPAPEDPKAQALPTEYLEKRAVSLRSVIATAIAETLTLAAKKADALDATGTANPPNVEVYT